MMKKSCEPVTHSNIPSTPTQLHAAWMQVTNSRGALTRPDLSSSLKPQGTGSTRHEHPHLCDGAVMHDDRARQVDRHVQLQLAIGVHHRVCEMRLLQQVVAVPKQLSCASCRNQTCLPTRLISTHCQQHSQ